MSANSVASKITEETFNFFQSASSGTALSYHTGQVVNSEAPATAAQYKQLAADTIATVDALISPVIELASLDNPTTSKIVANGGKLLGTAGLAANIYGAEQLRKTGIELLDLLNDPATSDEQWSAKFEVWTLDTISLAAGLGAAVVGTGLVVAASPALIAVLGTLSIAAGVASIIVDHNQGAQMPAIGAAVRHLDDAWQQVRNKFGSATTEIGHLKDRVVNSTVGALNELGVYVAGKSEDILRGGRNLINNPIGFFRDVSGVFYNFHTITLPNGLQQAWKTTREIIGDIEIVKGFILDGSSSELGDIIVTANIRTGEKSYSFSSEWSKLLSQRDVGEGLADSLLDYARSGILYDNDGSVISPQTGQSVSGASGNGPAQSLAEAASRPSSRRSTAPVLKTNDDGTITVGALRLNPVGENNLGQTTFGDPISGELVDVIDVPGGVIPVRNRHISGGIEVRSDLGPDGKIVNTVIHIQNNPIGIQFSDAGSVLGSTLGYRLAGGNQLVGIVSSATLKTLGENLGESLDAILFGKQTENGNNIKDVFRDFDGEFLANLKSAGVGAVSSFLTAELVNAIGLDGFAGELANTSAGYAIGQLANQLILEGANISDALRSLDWAQFGNAVGGFLGSKLASEIVSFDTVGGQIGSAVGAALGGVAVASMVVGTGSTATLAGVQLGALAGPVGAFVGAFVGFILGGLIGSVFGGTPSAWAESQWDESEGKFVVANVRSKHGGSKKAARSLASAASETFNGILSATGGELLDPTAVQSGTYGMRGKKFVYKPLRAGDITQKFSGKDAATRAIGFGVYTGLTDPNFKIAGGDVYVKRALYNTFEMGGLDPRNFDSSVLLGNIASAQAYESYLANSTVINALVAAQPDSVFAAETMINLARALELGLTRRHASDWYGGFDYLIREAGTNAANVEFGFDYDPYSDKISRLIGVGDYVLGDAIDIGGQTMIEAGAANDVIDLRGKTLADQRGYTVNGDLQDDIAVSGTDFTATSTTVNFAAGELRKQVTVAIASDADTAIERFLASLSNGTGVNAIGGEATATIISDSAEGAHLMIGRSFASEADGYSVFRLSLSKSVGTNVTVSLALAAGRADGQGLDFGASDASNLQVSVNGIDWINATSATFAAGATQLFVRTPVITDNGVGADGKPTHVEGNESFTLTATVTAGASALANGATPVSGKGTIIDAASGSTPYVWLDNVVVHEASGTATFTISRNRTTSEPASITFSTSDRRELEIDVAATVDGGVGNDTIYASDLGDNIFGGAGNDELYGGRLDDWLLGGDGDDVLDAGTADQNALGGDGNYLNGGAGNDILRGREGSDWLEGGDGTDTLTGGAGDDILAGGDGDGDSLKGGLDNDQYLVRLGDGADIAEDEPNGAPQAAPGGGDYVSQRMAGLLAGTIKRNWIGDAPGVVQKAVVGGEDAIVFGAGIGLGDIQMVRSSTDSDDLIIRVMQTVNGVTSFTGTQLTVKDWFSDFFKRIEWLKFADGNEVNISGVTSFIVGGDGNDVLIGTSGNDFVYGGGGNDALLLFAGDDIGNGGTGNDMVAGHSGRDLLLGGLGVDQLMGGKGKDALSGDGGGDDLYGGDEDDILAGGRGDGDVVVGGAGNDTFKYSRADGRDMVFDDYSNHWDVVWTSTGQWNEAAGYHYDPASGVVTGPGGALLRTNVGTAESPDLQWVGRFDYDDLTQTLRYFNPPVGAAIVANNGTDTIEFAPNINIQDVVLSRPFGTNDLVLNVTTENSEFSSTSQIIDSITIKDWYVTPGQIEKLAFYQTGILDIATGTTNLIAGADLADGADMTPLAGTAAADWITGGAGDDVIAGGSGNDILAGNSGFDSLKGEAGDDVLYGGAGNDILDGGSGSDTLIGGSGQDTASYASASGWVRAVLSDSWSNAGGAIGDSYSAIEDLTGGAGADILGGDDGDNILTGGQGNDTLRGGAGDDTYVWNVSDGADNIKDLGFTIEEAVTATGQLGAGYSVKSWAKTGAVDPGTGYHYWRLQMEGPGGVLVYDSSSYTYPPLATPTAPTPSAYLQTGWLQGFARTNGQQVTRFAYDSATSGGEDMLEFGAGIGLNDLRFTRTGNDLLIQYQGSSTAQLVIYDQFTANGAIETLQFADGLSLPISSILSATGAAQVVGSSADDLLLGQWGTFADDLAGGDGNDVLVGYAGNDLLYGGNGDDVFEGGLGADLIDGGANSASTEVGWGDTARYVRSASAVQVDLSTGAGTGGDAEGDSLVGIENVVGSEFADTLVGDAGGNRLSGLGGNDVINGGAGANVLDGGDGDDFINGGNDVDNIDGGEGNDVIYALDGDDLIQASAGNDQVYGGAGNDQILGDAGDDHLEGNWGYDQLQGGEGADVLVGGDGNDMLAGGAGADWLQGDAGDDTYLFDIQSGSDTIADGSGINSIVFDQSVSIDDIWLTRQGDDLKIGVIGGDATITVSNYFSATNASLVRSVSTATHTLFLNYAIPLVGSMTASSASTPGSMPAAIASQLATYWHEGHKAKPTGAALSLSLNEDNASAPMLTAAVDHDENILGYQLGDGPAHGSAAINGTTGAFVYTPDADFNGADSFTVVVTDADGQSTAIAVNVGVAAVNDAPRDIRTADGAAISVIEGAVGSPTGSDGPVKQLAATEIEGEAMTFSLADDAGDRFAITSDGLLIVQDPALLDHEAATSHTVRVRVIDIHGAATEKDFTVTVANWNEAPDTPLLSEARGLIAEPVSGGLTDRWTARFTLSDVDGTTPQLRLVSNPSNRFKVVGNEVRFADGYEPDFETLYNSGLTTSDTDGDGQMEIVLAGAVDATDGSLSSTGNTAFSIRIEDVNEAPTALNWTASVASVAERDRVANGTTLPAITIGTLNVVDPDIAGFADGSYSYSVSDSRFEVVGNVLRLKQGAALDYEAASSVTLTVIATDMSSAPLSIQRTINLTVDNRDDVLEGDANANTLLGQQNRDLLYAYSGNDLVDGGNGDDWIDGGSGDDILYGRAGSDTLYGGDGADTIMAGEDNDIAYGGANNGGTFDIIYGGDGNDQLNGEDGDDILLGGLGSDQLIGGAGSDWADYSLIRADTADADGVIVDLVTPASNTGAAAGDSYVSIENLRGTGVADTMSGDGSANRLEGLGGNDTLRGRAGDDNLQGGSGNDTLYGDDGADTLLGDDGDDIIYGGAGNDTLLGGAGNDQLYAESGDDYLDGGAGNDLLNGGIDNDTYIVTRSSEADTIYNYDPSGDDVDVLGFQDTNGAINDEDLWFEAVGNDMRISVIGTTSSVLIKDWYLISDPGSRSNYKIDFIIAGTRYSSQINVEGLVQLMATKTKPTSIAERDTLMADLTYQAQWATYWGTNAKPLMSAIGNRTVNEDGTISLTVTATDDITPNANIQMSATVISGTSVIANSGLVFGAPNSNGQRSFTINPIANASGTATIRVQATDAGGVTETQEFTVTVNAVADTPTVTAFTGGAGTAGQAGGIPLTLNVTFPDTDGSEVQEIWISGVPSGVTLSAGSYDGTAGVWKLTPAQTSGLKVNAPAGWSQDLSLSVTARATEAGQTAVSTAKTTNVVINAPPTGASLSGSVNENAANGTTVGTVTGIDPDAGDTFSYALLDNAGGRFALTSAGVLSVANGSLLNYEAATSHAITVRVTDSFGQIKDQVLSVAVNNVNEANSMPASYGMGVNENVAVGTLVGTVAASDPDSSGAAFGQQRYYFWNGSAASGTSSDGRYAIDAVTGQIKTNAGLNFEAGNTSVAYTVIARDNQGNAGYSQSSTSVTIGINNVNEANSLGGATLYVNENVGIGTTVGTIAASDPDGSGVAFGQQRYWFWDGANYSSQSYDGRYVIDNITGVIKTNAALNREAAEPGRNYVVRARDNQGNPGYTESAANFWIEIANVNEAPNSSGGTAWSMFDETGLGGNPANNDVVVRTLPLSDPDGTTPALELLSNPGGWFKIVGNQIRFTGANLDFDWFRNNGYGVADYNGDGRIEAHIADVWTRTNDGQYVSDSTLTQVFIQDINEPHSLNAGTFNVNEGQYGPNALPSVNLPSLVNEPDSLGGAKSWSFADGSYQSGIFQIEGSTGAIRLISGSVDYESLVDVYETRYMTTPYGGSFAYQYYVGQDPSRASFNLGVKAWDGNFSSTSTITINIVNVNEGPIVQTQPLDGIYGASSENQIYQDSPGVFRLYRLTRDRFARVTGTDPEKTGVTYQIVAGSAVNPSTTSSSFGSDSTVGDNGIPQIQIDSEGYLRLEVPNDDKDEWRGGYNYQKVTLTYNFTVRVTDASGVSTDQAISITMFQRGLSIDPVIIDLDGDGIELVPLENSTVQYDMDNDGILDQTAWAGADDGILALDRDGNGLIEGRSEISFLTEQDTAVTEIEALQRYDTNQNGFFDAQDEMFQSVRVWRDINQNGISEEGELQTLEEAGINAISLTRNVVEEEQADGSMIISTADVIRSDGSVRTAADVDLVFEQSNLAALAAPIVLDFDADGGGLISLASSTTRFDMDGDGVAERTGWIEAGDAFLALDRNGDGKISDIAEISFVGDLEGAKTDLEGLKAFDSNGDGMLNALDERFAEFKLWFDSNSNGVSDAGEIKSLAEVGLTSLSLASAAPEKSNDGSNIIYGVASYTLANGTSGRALDVALAYSPGDGSAGSEYSAWAGSATPSTSDTLEAPGINVERQEYGRKARKYLLSTTGGQMFIRARDDSAILDARSGLVGPATMLSFKDKNIGLLSPIILDLDGDGVEMRFFRKAKASFDMNGDGIGDNAGWVEKGDGFLVIDRNDDGLITTASELSLLTEKSGAKDNLDALAVLDSNKDGEVDGSDTRFGELRIWVDRDGDGITDTGELKSLGNHGIASISLAGRAVEKGVKIGSNAIVATSTFTRADGSIGSLGDVALAYKPGKEPFNRLDARLALITQQLAAFGAHGGEGEWRSRHVQAEALYDYFAG